MAACDLATEKRLSIISGLAWAYDEATRALLKSCTPGTSWPSIGLHMAGGVWHPRHTREQCSSKLGYQLRNWYYYT